MRNGNWGYNVDRSSPNWTGRVLRQSRITGYWSESRQKDKIPLSAYVFGLIALVTFFVSAYV